MRGFSTNNKMIEVLRRLSKIIMVRSALAVAMAKSVGEVRNFT